MNNTIIRLETKRLLLSTFEPQDAEALYELNNDPEVIQHTGDQAFPTVEDAAWLINTYEHYRKHRMGRMAMLLKATGEFVGWCGLKRHFSPDFIDLGFRLHKKYWGRGYATEASQACLQYGFEVLELDTITGRALLSNGASIRVLKKIGMRHVHDARLHDEAGAIFTIDRDRYRSMGLPTQKLDYHQRTDGHKDPEDNTE